MTQGGLFSHFTPDPEPRPTPAPELDAAAGTVAREKAIAQVEANAAPSFLDHAYAAVERVAARYSEFTTDSVWQELGEHVNATHDRRAMGAIMRRAAVAGLIAPTDGYVESSQAQNHRRPVKIWRSLIR